MIEMEDPSATESSRKQLMYLCTITDLNIILHIQYNIVVVICPGYVIIK